MVSSFKSVLKSAVSVSAERLSSFLKDSRGNFASIFALSSVPLLGFTGAAIEFTRYTMVNDNISSSLDAAGLAISQRAEAEGYEMSSLTGGQKETLRQYGKDFFMANFRPNPSLRDLNVDFEFTATTVRPYVSGKLKTSLLGIIGFDELNLGTDTEITLQGAGRLELALVLDVTGSMSSSSGGGLSRMGALKASVYDMMDTLYGVDPLSENDNVKVGVVPFNSMVNTGGTSQMQDAWLDLDATSHYHGNAFFHVEDPFDIDQNDKVNLYHLYDSIGSGTSWKGCVESRPFPLDELDTVPGSNVISSKINSWDDMPSGVDGSVLSTVSDAHNNAPSMPYSAGYIGDADNSKFVPFFYPDHPDCRITSGRDACNYRMRGSSSPGYIYDDINQDGDRENNYENRNFVRDWQYTNMQYGNSSARSDYNKVVCQYRYNISGTNSGGCNVYALQNDSAWSSIVAKTQATNTGRDEYRLRQAYPGTYNSATEKYEGKYDLSVSMSNGGEIAGQGPNRDCSTPIQKLTTVKKDIVDTIDALTPGGYTNTSIGSMWGWRVLSPEAPFTEGVDATVDTQWRKAVVIMTDGQNTIRTDSRTHNMSDFETYGFLYETD